MKKLLSILLCAVMLISAAVLPAYAEDGQTEKTTATEIQNEDQATDETVEEASDVTDYNDGYDPYDIHFNLFEVLAGSVGGVLDGVATLPLILISPILFLILPPLGIAAVVYPLIGLSLPFALAGDYLKDVFTGYHIKQLIDKLS